MPRGNVAVDGRFFRLAMLRCSMIVKSGSFWEFVDLALSFSPPALLLLVDCRPCDSVSIAAGL